MIAFIIFGTRTITSHVRRGKFLCPVCERDTYNLKKVRRFFTLYFIPLIPLDVVGHFVECDFCLETFDPMVLEYEQQHQRAVEQAVADEMSRAFKQVLLLIMMADDIMEEAEISAVANVYLGFFGQRLERPTIHAEATFLEQEGLQLAECVEPVVPLLNEEGRAMLLEGAIMVALSDGRIDPHEEPMLYELAQLLGFDADRVDALISQMSQDPVPAGVPVEDADEIPTSGPAQRDNSEVW